MSDLTDEELAHEWSIEEPRHEDWPERRMIIEIRRHRAALAADEERVRSVVREAADFVADELLTVAERDAIATRAAKQLASAAVRPGPRCTECSRFRLTSDGENYDARCVCGHLATVRP